MLYIDKVNYNNKNIYNYEIATVTSVRLNLKQTKNIFYKLNWVSEWILFSRALFPEKQYLPFTMYLFVEDLDLDFTKNYSVQKKMYEKERV